MAFFLHALSVPQPGDAEASRATLSEPRLLRRAKTRTRDPFASLRVAGIRDAAPTLDAYGPIRHARLEVGSRPRSQDLPGRTPNGNERSMKAADYRKYKYRDAATATEYDERRFGSRSRSRDDRATRLALATALGLVSDGELVLDLPAGTGRFTDLVLRRRLRYVGADISREMLQVCEKKHASIRKAFELVECDAHELPFRNDTFDCVLAFKFLSLLPEETRLAVLREMLRVGRRYLIAQSKHMRTWAPRLALKLLLSRAFGSGLRLRKYAQRRALPAQIESAGWTPVARVRIRPSLVSKFWPFGLEYLAVYEKPSNAEPH